ncbi:isoprenyl transferase [Pelagicoccus sp. SDUM812002]|uniref:isoprenyl transferase n=1 Tax=Pelagicoccus sp. SDUM812002 TaxID=3041266 RepID=UPI00280C8413|nr:isoprenyl transferase [Pelagicoccus sp. SDUM812002]MDQ8184849.1 isoprenyl transferase [Pelagicoccus sp. SDUM812002]
MIGESTVQKPDPQHIGIIMDGNGRWAKQRGHSRPRGHKEGAKATRTIIDACQDLGIRYLTLYAFSAENWNRPNLEVRALMELLELFLARETKTLVKRRVRLHAIGRIDELPTSARKALEKAIEATKEFDDWHLTLALNYSSRNEVLDAAKAFAQAVARGEISPDTTDWGDFSKHLDTAELPDPDLIIRTSGETRISNFLLMQSAYAEFYFTETLWPDFDKEQLEKALSCYRNRERRYGKTGEQLATHSSTAQSNPLQPSA